MFAVVSTHGLFLGPAERADIIIDFSQVPDGSTLIFYNDAPAPVPAFDTRYDYYTEDQDQSATGNNTGGAATTAAGMGPNTRTIMQIRVNAALGTSGAFNLAGLTTALPTAYAQTQAAPIVPETAYNAAFPLSPAATDTYSRIQDTSLTFTQAGTSTAITQPMLPKAIQELFTLDYGRMNATLGVRRESSSRHSCYCCSTWSLSRISFV